MGTVTADKVTSKLFFPGVFLFACCVVALFVWLLAQVPRDHAARQDSAVRAVTVACGAGTGARFKSYMTELDVTSVAWIREAEEWAARCAKR